MMTDLFDRLYPDRSVETAIKIPVHSFRAALGDYATGNTSRAEIVNYWNMDSEAQTDLDVLLVAIDSKTALQTAEFLLELDSVMIIASEGAKYTVKSEFRTRLGL
jgi:hypothetical protein